jgi:hypothetical protein
MYRQGWAPCRWTGLGAGARWQCDKIPS